MLIDTMDDYSWRNENEFWKYLHIICKIFCIYDN